MSYPAAYPDWFRALVVVVAIAAALGAFALLTGCATWSHPFKDASAFHMDAYACEVQAAPVQDPWRALEMKKSCMRLKGWRDS